MKTLLILSLLVMALLIWIFYSKSDKTKMRDNVVEGGSERIVMPPYEDFTIYNCIWSGRKTIEEHGINGTGMEMKKVEGE